MKTIRYIELEKIIVMILIAWFVFQAVISGSLLRYSDYKLIVSVIYSVNKYARLFLIIFGLAHLFKGDIKTISIPRVLFLCLFFFVLVLDKGFNQSNTLLDTFFIAFVFGDILKKKQVIDCFLITIIVSCAFVFLAYFMGLLPEFIILRKDGRERIGLGFAHPNSLGYYVMIICFLLVIRKGGNISNLYLMILILAAFFIYKYPNSNSSALSVGLFAVYLALQKMYYLFYGKDLIKNPVFRFIAFIIVPGVLIATVILVSSHTGMDQADEMMHNFSARFSYANRAIREYGIHLLGSDIPIVGRAAQFFSDVRIDYFALDCFYVQILVKMGIIPGVYVMLCYVMFMIIARYSGDTDSLVILMILAVYAISEAMILTVPTSFIFIICAINAYSKPTIPTLRFV